MRVLRLAASSRTVKIAAALFAAYFAVAAFVPFKPLIEILNWGLIGVAGAVTIAYAPVAWRALAAERIDQVQQLTLGICLTWIAAIMMRLWAVAWRATGSPDWMLNSKVVGFFVYAAILGGVLHLTAPGAVDGRVPRRNWVTLGVAIGAALTVSGAVFVFSG